MKIRVHRRLGALTKLAPIQLTLETPMDVLAFVVGRQLLFQDEPQQVVHNAPIRGKAELLRFWHQLGVIHGPAQQWVLNTRALKSVKPTKVSTAPPPLYLLAKEFRLHLKRRKLPMNQPRLLSKLRHYCRFVAPEQIHKMIPAFFQRTSKDYSIDAFGRFLQFRLRITSKKFLG